MNGHQLDTSASFAQFGLLFHLISLGKLTSIPLLSMHLKARLPRQSPRGFLIFSPSIYIQVPNPSFFRVLLPRLGGAPKSTLYLLDKVQSKGIRLINNPNLTKSFQPLSHRRLDGYLSIFYRYFSRALFSGGQEYYSSSSEAFQDHQRLKSFTPFPSFTAYFTHFISQILIHPNNMQLMDRLALLH